MPAFCQTVPSSWGGGRDACVDPGKNPENGVMIIAVPPLSVAYPQEGEASLPMELASDASSARHLLVRKPPRVEHP
jgi:hypothetical protein